MFTLLRFLFIFFLGWISAVWIYDVHSPMQTLSNLYSTNFESSQGADKLFALLKAVREWING